MCLQYKLQYVIISSTSMRLKISALCPAMLCYPMLCSAMLCTALQFTAYLCLKYLKNVTYCIFKICKVMQMHTKISASIFKAFPSYGRCSNICQHGRLESFGKLVDQITLNIWSLKGHNVYFQCFNLCLPCANIFNAIRVILQCLLFGHPVPNPHMRILLWACPGPDLGQVS